MGGAFVTMARSVSIECVVVSSDFAKKWAFIRTIRLRLAVFTGTTFWQTSAEFLMYDF